MASGASLGFLDDEDENEKDHLLQKEIYLRKRRDMLHLCISICLAAALIMSLAVNSQLTRSRQQPELSCGTSIAEALDSGCSFDYLSKSWLHPDCPRTGTEEFLGAGGGRGNQSWTYWTEQAGVSEVEDISTLADIPGAKWWSKEKEHLTHCAYLFIRMSHALRDGSRVDGLTGNTGHTKHCALYLLNRSLEAPTSDGINTIGNSFFGTC